MAHEPLLGPDDAPAVTVVNAESRAPLVLVCDHASPAVPRALADLGLGDDELSRHIALDIGADAVTRMVAERLGLCAIFCGYSRLVVDVNRYLADPSSFAQVSDGIDIPGNQQLSEHDKGLRVSEIREPYHAAIDTALRARGTDSTSAGVIAIHSFTPHMDGFARPWHVGVLWDQDPRFAKPLLDHFTQHPQMCVGDNQPYSGRHPADYTIDHHGERQGRPCASLEIRQDLLLDNAQQALWARRVADGLEDLLEQTQLFVKRGIDDGDYTDK
ncbi:MAG: N-formylglutamate amidohydrolase [Gammaproteobacteria bacterium]